MSCVTTSKSTRRCSKLRIWRRRETTCATSWGFKSSKTSISNSHPLKIVGLIKVVFKTFSTMHALWLMHLENRLCMIGRINKYRNEVRNWFCNFILEPYKKLFAPGNCQLSIRLYRSTWCKFWEHKEEIRMVKENIERVLGQVWAYLPKWVESKANDCLWILS